jgi:hypothetical protein
MSIFSCANKKRYILFCEESLVSNKNQRSLQRGDKLFVHLYWVLLLLFRYYKMNQIADLGTLHSIDLGNNLSGKIFISDFLWLFFFDKTTKWDGRTILEWLYCCRYSCRWEKRKRHDLRTRILYYFISYMLNNVMQILLYFRFSCNLLTVLEI